MTIHTEYTNRSWRAAKLDHLGSSIFAEVASWKEEAKANGKDLIDLGIGSPDQGPSPFIRETLSREVLKEGSYAYPKSSGSEIFLTTVAKWMNHRFQVDLNSQSEIISLMGSQDGLAHLAQAICNPGDLAMVPNPGYPIYSGSLAIAGVRAYEIPLKEDNQFMPDLDAIPDEIWAEAVFILLSFPGNPIASAASQEYFEKLIAKASKWNVLIVHDMAYSEMGFDGYRPMSILSIPGAIKTAVEFHSFSKSFQMAGCRVAFLAGNEQAIQSLRILKENIDYGVFEPIQQAAVTALEQAIAEGKDYTGPAPLYEARRNLFVDLLAKEGWNIKKPCATMFLWAALPEPFRGKPQEWNSRSFAKALLLQSGVAVIPGDAFGSEGEGYVRIALVQEQERLEEAARRIGEFIRSYR
ncbi:aminotransferase class I/II-fold pyridoxal phosphate-dependent enzyme [Paenibacillus gallinarum]|uniref:Aminotransferase class I/II-fold pyridoxal phosphate-dependent enzyme n=1 Tax=Paenibacillus gallinarum TaxID=2762232 RepID=A0ABR8SY77_9BACL|nr:aminotransferase class I/II-fold pyridoxal phosphate-dependent enzyme [Paenibacillus gallinarum]MBD7968469.1 aminotransferase class I/II-fold pyridoxal phosphate-dependent enzyme [Paenibacillus gallinarum]